MDTVNDSFHFYTKIGACSIRNLAKLDTLFFFNPLRSVHECQKFAPRKIWCRFFRHVHFMHHFPKFDTLPLSHYGAYCTTYVFLFINGAQCQHMFHTLPQQQYVIANLTFTLNSILKSNTENKGCFKILPYLLCYQHYQLFLECQAVHLHPRKINQNCIV